MKGLVQFDPPSVNVTRSAFAIESIIRITASATNFTLHENVAAVCSMTSLQRHDEPTASLESIGQYASMEPSVILFDILMTRNLAFFDAAIHSNISGWTSQFNRHSSRHALETSASVAFSPAVLQLSTTLPFTFTLSQPRDIILAARHLPFVPGTLVSIASLACTIKAFSSDFSLLWIVTPPYSQVCARVQCPGYVNLTLQEPASIVPVNRSSSLDPSV
jgi:hypothetical protein